MLNSSIARLGDTFRQRRLDRNAEASDASQEEIRRELARASESRQNRGLDIEQRRLDTEVSRSEQAKHAADLKEAFADLADTTKRIQTGMATLATAVKSGKMTSDDADGYFQQAVDSLPDEIKGKVLTDPSMKAAYEGNIPWESIGASDKAPKPFSEKLPGGTTMEGVYSPATGAIHTPPQQFNDVTEETPADPGSPEIPATEGGFFSKGTPAVPAIPATPKRTVRTRVPVGAAPVVPPMPGAAATAPPMPGSTQSPMPTARTFKDKTGRRFKYVGAMEDPAQDKDPANWQLVP